MKRRGPNARTRSNGYGARIVQRKYGSDPITHAMIHQLIQLDKVPSESEVIRRAVAYYAPRRFQEIAEEQARAAGDDAPSQPSQSDPCAK